MGRATKTKIYEQTATIIDSNSEILSLETKIVRQVTPEDFIQVYLRDMSAILGVTALSELKVLMVLWRMASFNPESDSDGNKLYLIKGTKEEIAKELGLSYGTINNTINNLAERKLLIKLNRGIYILNPKYFFKGYYKDRLKVLNVHLKYEIQNKMKIDNDES